MCNLSSSRKKPLIRWLDFHEAINTVIICICFDGSHCCWYCCA